MILIPRNTIAASETKTKQQLKHNLILSQPEIKPLCVTFCPQISPKHQIVRVALSHAVDSLQIATVEASFKLQ
jgi:hypothetical protein